MAEKMNKKGQMVIWVIIAIAIIGTIILFLFLRGEIKPITGGGIDEDPSGFISDCARGNANNILEIIFPQGGFVEPEHSKLYKGINVSYLCYNSGNYYPCINEHPLFINEIEEEIKSQIEPEIEQCFQDYKFEMEKRGATLNLGEMNFELRSAPDRIFIDIEREMEISKDGESSSYSDFDVEIISPAYNIARVAMEIASQEAKYCYFEYVGYMILYPDFKISRDSLSDSTEIYTIEDKKSRRKMNYVR